MLFIWIRAVRVTGLNCTRSAYTLTHTHMCIMGGIYAPTRCLAVAARPAGHRFCRDARKVRLTSIKCVPHIVVIFNIRINLCTNAFFTFLLKDSHAWSFAISHALQMLSIKNAILSSSNGKYYYYCICTVHLLRFIALFARKLKIRLRF